MPSRCSTFVNALFQEGLSVDFTNRGQTAIEQRQTLPAPPSSRHQSDTGIPVSAQTARVFEVLKADAELEALFLATASGESAKLCVIHHAVQTSR